MKSKKKQPKLVAEKRVAAGGPNILEKACKGWRTAKITAACLRQGLLYVHKQSSRNDEPSSIADVEMEEVGDTALFKYFPGLSFPFGQKGMNPDSTEGDYIYHLQALCRFVIMIGSYDDALILCGVADAPPVSVESLCLYMKYKRGEKGSPLLGFDNNSVIDAAGAPVLCEGTWKDPHKQDQFKAAVAALHSNNGHNHLPTTPCVDCQKERMVGCELHRGHARLLLQGDTTKHIDFVNVDAALKKEGANYVPTSAKQIMPREVKQIQRYLTSSGQLKDLQTIVMLLIGIDVFLRHDELGEVKFDDFLKKCHTITADGIKSLAMQIQGKCDKTIKYFYVHMNKTHHEFCTLRHLLPYVYLLNIKGGYLFPTEEELKNPPADGIYKTYMTYDTFSKRLDHLFRTVCV